MSRYSFKPITEAPQDARSLVLADETGWQAVGHFKDDTWWMGHEDQPGTIEQLDFEPTRFAYPLRSPSPTTTPDSQGDVMGGEI